MTTTLRACLTGLGAALALSACEPLPAAQPEADACGAAGYQSLVGQTEADFAAITFPGPVRMIRPGQAVTMDFREDRLNIEFDAAGRVLRVFCG